jgi:transposase
MAKGRPAGLRLETAVRTQIEFQQSSLDDLLSFDHRARQVWDYVEELDLSVLYGRVQTTVSSSGRPAIDPAILVSLWLYATLEGVGSARLLDRLCKSDAAYLWLLGGVSVNYHTLSDFRSEAGPVLDELLSQSLTGLIASGLVDVRTLAVDGMKLQSLASGRSFKSAGRLAELHRASVATVRKLRAEIEEDPAASERRIKARQLAAAEDRARRLAKARKAQAKIEERRDEQAAEQRRKEERKDHDPARASLSDPEARIMKMGDGSYRAAYNVQVKTTPDGGHVVGVSVTDHGADYGLLTAALDEIQQRYAVTPQRVLADGGYFSKADIERLHARRVELFCPLPLEWRAPS